MGKYSILQDSPSVTFTGVKFTEEYTTTVHIDDTAYTILGYPAHPECGTTLQRDFGRELWICRLCRKAWDTESLVNMLLEYADED